MNRNLLRTMSLAIAIAFTSVIPAQASSNASNGSNASNTSNTSNAAKVPQSIEDAVRQAEELTLLLKDKKWSEFFKKSGFGSDSPLKQKAAVNPFLQRMGAFKEILDNRFIEKNGVRVIRVVASHENAEVKYVYYLDKGNNLVSYYVMQSPKGIYKGPEELELPTSEFSKDELFTFGEFDTTGMFSEPADSIEKKKTVVLIVPGSGPNGIEMKVGAAGNKVFNQLTAELNRNGYTVARFNKCTYQAAEFLQNITIEQEYVNDVNELIRRTKERFPGYRIVVAGHSQGGMMLPKIIADNPDVAAAISLAGTTRSLWDIIVEQTQRYMDTVKTMKEEDKKTYIAQTKDQMNKLKNVTKDETFDFGGLTAKYAYSLNSLNIPELAKKIRIPILVIQGDADWQVTMKDFEQLKVDLAGNDKAEYKVIKGMSHMLMPTKGKEFAKDYDDANQIDGELVKSMVEFLDRTGR